jgi:hypothetical protein
MIHVTIIDGAELERRLAAAWASQDPATKTPLDIPEPLPPAPPPVNPYDVPGAPRSPDPVEEVEPEKAPSKPAPSPDEDWVSEPDQDRKATVRDKPAPRRK